MAYGSVMCTNYGQNIQPTRCSQATLGGGRRPMGKRIRDSDRSKHIIRAPVGGVRAGNEGRV